MFRTPDTSGSSHNGTPGRDEEKPSSLYTVLCNYPIITAISAIQAVNGIGGELSALVFSSYAQVHIGSHEVVQFAGISKSVGSIIAIAFVGAAGRLSDIYGRKLVLVIQSICGFLPTVVFFAMGKNHQSFWIAGWMHCILPALSGHSQGPGGHGPVWTNAIFDKTPPKDRPQAQALGQIVGKGLELPLMFLVRHIVFRYHSDRVEQISGLLASGISLVMLLLLIPKATTKLDDSSRKTAGCNMLNPMAPARIACSNRQVALLCATSAFIHVADSLPHSTTTKVYINQQLGITDDSNAQQEMNSTLPLFKAVVGPIAILSIAVMIRLFSRVNCVYVAMLLNSLYIFSMILLHAYPYDATLYMMSFFGAFLQLPNMFLTALISEMVTSQQQVGTCLGAQASILAVISIFIAPLEANLYNFLEPLGYSWVMYAIFGSILLSGMIPLTFLKQSLSPHVGVPKGGEPLLHHH